MNTLSQRSSLSIYTRFLSAALRPAVFMLSITALIAMFGYNAIQYRDQASYVDSTILPILEEPNNPDHVIALAEHMFYSQRLDRAKRELALAESLTNKTNTNVQGAQTPLSYYEQWKHGMQSRGEHIAYWLKMIKTYPTYPDAYVQTAYLLAQNGNTQSAKHYFQQAQLLDPLIDIPSLE